MVLDTVWRNLPENRCETHDNLLPNETGPDSLIQMPCSMSRSHYNSADPREKSWHSTASLVTQRKGSS